MAKPGSFSTDRRVLSAMSRALSALPKLYIIVYAREASDLRLTEKKPLTLFVLGGYQGGVEELCNGLDIGSHDGDEGLVDEEQARETSGEQNNRAAILRTGGTTGG